MALGLRGTRNSGFLAAYTHRNKRKRSQIECAEKRRETNRKPTEKQRKKNRKKRKIIGWYFLLPVRCALARLFV